MTRTPARRRAGPFAWHSGRHQGHHGYGGFPDRDGVADLSAAIVREGDAAVVMMLKQAGATVVGKTTTTAFASRDPTATLNPRNHGGRLGRFLVRLGSGRWLPGMIPLALGTQTGGSVIRPASYCGVAAIKPSYRLLPTVGVKCYSWTLDTVGAVRGPASKHVQRGLAAMTGRPELLLPRRHFRPRASVW